ncbi:60S ribosomal export protein NMD3 [Citrus sinensis]|nr:60S ribosomal export protein NMD3 [Citrus sinensis]
MVQAAGISAVRKTVSYCKCGITMVSNASNMCVTCLKSEVDITESLQKHANITPSWTKAKLESRELLTFCLKRLNNLNRVRLVNAEFLTVQKEVLEGVIVEQSDVVMSRNITCVNLRCHVAHRRGFTNLEQLIQKHDAPARATKIKKMDHGIEFFFSGRSHAVKFVEFVGEVVPAQSRHEKQLVSRGTKSRNCKCKYTCSVEINAISAHNLGNLGPFVICTKVTNSIALLDPFTLRHCYLDADQYWRSPFKALHTSRQLVEYIVLDVKYVLAGAQVARVLDFGKNDTILSTRTHLGHLLILGDYAIGYDLHEANQNDIELENYKSLVPPDTIKIKKSYKEKNQRKHRKPNPPKLKPLEMEVDGSKCGADREKVNNEYEEFLRDLMASVTDKEDVPSVPLDYLLADLDSSDKEEGDDSMIE